MAGDVPPAAGAVEDALTDRLARLTIGPPSGTSAAFAATVDVPVVAGPGDRSAEPPMPGVRRIRVEPDGDDWRIVLERIDRADVTLPAGRGQWLEGFWPAALLDHDDVPSVSAAAVDADGGRRPNCA
jgi:hypothetical protein